MNGSYHSSIYLSTYAWDFDFNIWVCFFFSSFHLFTATLDKCDGLCLHIFPSNDSAGEEFSFSCISNSVPDFHCSWRAGDILFQVCGSRDRGDVMGICGDESGSLGCGIGTLTDCCDPPLPEVPEEDWFCPKCSSTQNCLNNPAKKKKGALSLSKSSM
ncbi:uncharacterized protein LOC130738287 isoform X3 [Lotus japonicus]|uniref:uncharacterized protein LOC130738287 isoform X3 n=1 Tax=Lotus japonicus TaxID=34305 RepID=UPI0025856E32|nr:uncharacterized protein LOC130738287 isoform X3 [Lotus japonicus]